MDITANMHSRNNYLDFIKGIAIILVIIGHVLNHTLGELCYKDPLFIFIYSFHMPLFMGISGYLFYYSAKKSFSETVVKKYQQLIVPLFFWTFIIYILIVLKKPDDNFVNTILLYGRLFPTWYWFLVVLFISSVLLLFTNTYLKKWYYHLMVLLFVLAIPDFSSMRFLKYMYPIFLLGFIYHLYSSIINKYINVVVGISAVIFIAGLLLWDKDYYIYTTGSQVLFRDGIHFENVYNNLFRYCIGITGSIIVLFVCKIVFNKFRIEWINKIGKETLGIYLIHLPLLEIVFYKRLMFFNDFLYLQILIIALLLLLVSYLLVRLLSKWKFSRKFLLGKD